MDSEALLHCVRRLWPHVDATQIALTGGVAVGMHVRGSSDDRARSTAADDVDFVAASIEAVRPSVTSDFLVSHFHRPQPGYPKFLVQLVDPLTRLRVDVFPDSLGALARAVAVSIADLSIRMVDAETLLAHKLELLSAASPTSPVDEKHYADARRLGAICGRDVPEPSAASLVRTDYSRDLEAICHRCEASRCAAFPLAPKRAILDILGYV